MMETFRQLYEFENDEYADNINMTEGLGFQELMDLLEDSEEAFKWCHQEKNRKPFMDMLTEMSNFTKGIYGSYWYLDTGEVNGSFRTFSQFKSQWKREWEDAVERYDFPKLLKSAVKKDPIMYRVVAIGEGEKVDYEHPGHCWAFKKKGASNYRATSIDSSYGKVIYLKGTTPWHNIDWVKSVLLTCTVYNDEMEFRVVDDSKVSIILDDPKSKEADKLSKEEKKVQNQLNKFKKHLIDNGDGTYDFNGDLNGYEYKDLIAREGVPFKLNKVNGDFLMQNTKVTTFNNFPHEVTGSVRLVTETTSLIGFPQVVGKDVMVTGSHNLKDLVGLPSEVHGDLTLRFLKTASPKGCPISVEGNVNLMALAWTDLSISPRHIGGTIYCDNLGVISLEGMTDDVKSICLNECYGLYDLKGCPKHLKGDFEVFLCQELNSYEGMPQEIDGNVRMQYNHEVSTLDGFCKKVGGRLNLGFKRDVTREDLKCEVGAQVIINGKEI